MTFTLTIDMDNAASSGWSNDANFWLAMQLGKLASALETMLPPIRELAYASEETRRVIDSNGNTVGRYQVQP